MDGYKKVKTDVPKAQATVTFDPAKTNPQKLVAAINKGTSFKASVKK